MSDRISKTDLEAERTKYILLLCLCVICKDNKLPDYSSNVSNVCMTRKVRTNRKKFGSNIRFITVPTL